MNIGIPHSIRVNDLVKKAASVTEKLLLEQLGDLVKDQILVIESSHPCLIENVDGTFSIQQSVKLVSRHQEVINSLKEQNEKLRQSLVDSLGRRDDF